MLQKLKALLNRVRASGFLLKAHKCNLFQTSVTYLGFEWNGSGIKLQDKKVNKIMHWPAPQSVDEFKKFLGFVTFFSSHLKDFAKTWAPFYKLLKKNQRFEWSKECQDAFQNLKKLVTSAPVLRVLLDKGKIHFDVRWVYARPRSIAIANSRWQRNFYHVLVKDLERSTKELLHNTPWTTRRGRSS